MHPDVAMNSRTNLKDASLVLRNASASGFAIKTDISEVGEFTIHSIGLPVNPYTNVAAHVLVVVRHPRRGRRASASIRTIKGGDERRGPWDAHYAIRETAKDLASWNKWLGILSGSLESSGL